MRNERQTVDRRPGPIPEIRMDRDGLIYVIVPAGVSDGARLIIRCGADGEIWIAIEGGHEGLKDSDR
jgi:hypothetical protein